VLSAGRSRVFLVDDHPLIRRGLTSMINQESDLIVCGESSGQPGTCDLIVKEHPDVIVLDLVLQNSSGLELIKQLRVELPDVPVLVLSMHPETTFAERALRAGASGYIMKQEASEVILTALRSVIQGGIFLSEPMKVKMLQGLIEGGTQDKRFGIDRLSDREIEVLRFLGCGFSTRQIADKLHLSIKTIEVYRANLKHKLRLQNGPELVQYAIQWLHDEGGSVLIPPTNP